MQNPPNVCPNCKAPIPPDAPGGLCPACVLLGAAGASHPGSGAIASAPTVEELSAAFPDLEVIEMIGHGGMGVIFKARQPRLDRFVALKILPPHLAQQTGFTERFTREARALARLSHPNIVAVYDFGERDSYCFLTMEFVNGVNLRQAMRAGITPEQALGLVPKICEALQFAHDRGVLHRDIKPENILLDTAGTPKLADFGIAKLAEENATERHLTLSGAALGTAAYMAPEQIERPGAVDHRADIYSLGVVLYEMLTGELPIGRFAAPSQKAKVAPGVDDVVLRALEKERERRQQSATEMKTQVEHASHASDAADADRTQNSRVNATQHSGMRGNGARVFLLLAMLTALLIPLAAANRSVGEIVSPVTLSYLVAVFGAVFALWPVVFPDPLRQTQRREANSNLTLRIAVICAVLSLPVAAVIFLFAMPMVQARGVSPGIAVMIGLAIPVFVGIFAAVITALCRTIVRAGAPRWAAICIAILIVFLTPFAILFTSYAAARGQRTNPVSAFAQRPTMSVVMPTENPAIGKWTQGSVELVAVAQHPSEQSPWWRMDAGRAVEGPFINTGNRVFPGSNESAYEFYFRTRNLAPGASLPIILVEHSRSSSSGGIPALVSAADTPLSGYHMIATTLPANLSRTNIKVGVSYEAWHTVSTSFPGNATATQVRHEGQEWYVAHGTAFETKDGEVVATITHSRPEDWDARLIGINQDGVEVTTTRVSRINEQSEWHFPDASLKSLKQLCFQVRPVRWVEFRDVALRPNPPQ